VVANAEPSVVLWDMRTAPLFVGLAWGNLSAHVLEGVAFLAVTARGPIPRTL